MQAALKKLFLMDMLYAFVAAALAVMIPLYLVDIDMDVMSIGLIISIIPLGYMLMRLLFASIVDQVGTKSVEVVESLATIVAIAIYALSESAQMFAVAQFSEGVREAGFWATARTDIILNKGKEKMERAFAYLLGFRLFADGMGRVAIGIIIIYLSFQTSLALLFMISIIMLVIMLTINKNPYKGFPVESVVIKRIFHKRSRHFWYHSLGIGLQQVIPAVLLAFLLPLYLYSHLGFDYQTTGALLAVFSLLTGAANLLLVKYGVSTSAILFIVLMMVPALVLAPYAGDAVLAPIIVMALGSGAGNILSERMVANEVEKRKDKATEISTLQFPFMVGQFIFIALGGAVIAAWGFMPVFILCAFITLYFVVYAQHIFKKA
jgi:MFS family permease